MLFCCPFPREERDSTYKCRRKSNVDIINEEVKGISSEEEEIEIRKCRRKSQVDILKKEMKGISSE